MAMTNLLTMLPAVLFLFSVLVDGSTVKFQATPDSLEPLVTKTLTLVCSLEDAPTTSNEKSDSTDFKYVSSIIVSVDGEDIAVIDAHSPATKLGNTTGVVSGRFAGKGLDGRLQVSWAYPGDHQTGHYVCLVGGTNQRNRQVTVTKEIDVHKKNLNIQQLIGHIKNLQATVDKQSRTLASLTAKAKPGVLFSALLQRTTHIARGETVIYNKVFTNLGNGYSNSTGKFTCTVTGYYTFQVSAFCVNGKSAFLSLQHNGRFVVTIIVKTRDTQGTSNSASLKLTRGDVVKVVGFLSSSYLFYNSNYISNTFSGRLIALE